MQAVTTVLANMEALDRMYGLSDLILEEKAKKKVK